MTENQDRIIRLVQSSTRNLIDSFSKKTEILSGSTDIKKLIREGYDPKIVQNTAKSLFGSDVVKFLAIDGTLSEEEKLSMLIFYSAAFGYVGQVEFSEKGCISLEPSASEGGKEVSTAIPIHESDIGEVIGIRVEAGIDADIERLPSALMHLAEYYIALKTLSIDPEIKIVLFDRQLAIDIPHLISNVTDLLENYVDECVLCGLETEFGIVTPLDLELARMFHPNEGLEVPSPRSQFIKYAAIKQLMSHKKGTFVGYEDLLSKIRANPGRLKKLTNDLTDLDSKYCLFEKDSEGTASLKNTDSTHHLILITGAQDYWQRVFSAAMRVAGHIFDTPEGEHPLIFKKDDVKKWITATDLEYLTLIMIYAMLRQAWEKNVLVIGLIKDMAAAEMIKTIIPILEQSGKIHFVDKLPNLSSDRMLLQVYSIMNANSVKTPWKTFEFDACFRTIAPIQSKPNQNDNILSEGIEKIEVAGAFKNLISAERMFVKSYIQLWNSEGDPRFRSFVFSYDRPCYPGYDMPGELLLHHLDNKIEEEIRPIIHFDRDSEISHLVMAILKSMAGESIPECIGHNYPLFLADKKAKAILHQARSAVISAVSFEMARTRMDQEVLFGPSFRQFRSTVENARRRRGA